MNCNSYSFTRHAVEQMFSRKISDKETKKVIREGEVIHFYEEDKPYPSYLVFAYINERPIHVLVAANDESKECIVITAYEPSLDLWKEDFKTRKR